MAWGTMVDKAAQDVYNASDDDQQRLNLLWLAQMGAQAEVTRSTDYTPGTSWADVDATNLKITFTSYGNPVIFYYTLWWNQAAGAGESDFRLDLDGSPLAQSERRQSHSASATFSVGMFMPYVLAAGSHTIKLQARYVTVGGTIKGTGIPMYMGVLYG